MECTFHVKFFVVGLTLRESSAGRDKVVELELWRKLLFGKSMLESTLSIKHSISEISIINVLSRGSPLGNFLNQSSLAIEFIVSIIACER